jgi:hypothetical protein
MVIEVILVFSELLGLFGFSGYNGSLFVGIIRPVQFFLYQAYA